MTRITTIASGLPRAGKTHLGINLALELVRRGRRAGLYHDVKALDSINILLNIPLHGTTPHSVSKHAVNNELVARGYQGIDLLFCKSPLENWHGFDNKRLGELLAEFTACYDCDDYFIDTSCMTPRETVACCKAADRVMLVITPDSQSQAEAYALLKILQLNDVSLPVLLVINKLEKSADVGSSIHARFSGIVKEYLGLETGFLGTVTEDQSIGMAEGCRQAFTSVFPESEASADIVSIADRLEKQPPSGAFGGRPLAGYMKHLAGIMGNPVKLAGGAVLADREVPPAAAPPPGGHVEGTRNEKEMSLLQFDGLLADIEEAMAPVPGRLQLLASELQTLFECLATADQAPFSVEKDRPLDLDLIRELIVALLAVIRTSARPGNRVHFQVDAHCVNGEGEGWLGAGHYLRHSLLVCDQKKAARDIRVLLDRVPGIGKIKAQDGEYVYEGLSPSRDACLNVLYNRRGELNIHFWQKEGAGAASGKPAAEMTRSETLFSHPQRKALH